MEKVLDEIRNLVQDADTWPLNTKIPGLSTIRGDVPDHQLAALYNPMIGFTIQGTKVLSIGGRESVINGPAYYVLPVFVPATATVRSCEHGEPYMSLGLEIDHTILQSLLSEMQGTSHLGTACEFAACDIENELLEALLRLLRLLEKPDEIPALAPVYKREILYRVLTGPHGFHLRQFGYRESNTSRIDNTVRWLRVNYRQPVDVGNIAKQAGMAVTTFHRHFKSVTGLSPIQFQKQLRLLEAKNLLVFSGSAVATAAYEVGYESPSQFSREYTRFFGKSPNKHAEAIRHIEAARIGG